MKVILKYKKYIFITLLSVLLGLDLYFSVLFGTWAKGAMKCFFLDDEASGYASRHLYLVSIIFSYLSLIVVCLFNKIDEKVKFVSVYASICHIVIFSILTIVSYYIAKDGTCELLIVGLFVSLLPFAKYRHFSDELIETGTNSFS